MLCDTNDYDDTLTSCKHGYYGKSMWSCDEWYVLVILMIVVVDYKSNAGISLGCGWELCWPILTKSG